MHTGITISPLGGLANRMRAILSARALAADADVPLRVLWNTSSELGCAPQWLFNTRTWEFDWRTTSPIAHHWLWKPAGKANLFLPALWQPLRFRHRLNGTGAASSLIDDARQGMYITSGQTFYPYQPSDAQRIFSPTPAIAAMVEQKLEPMASHRKVGVHIRRTDNTESILNSPDSLFTSLIRKELESDSDTMIYLATDSEATKQKLLGEFGNKIITSPHQACRSSRQGMMEAWAEMLTLSRMDIIIGSFYSSFSEMAAQIGSTPLLIASQR